MCRSFCALISFFLLSHFFYFFFLSFLPFFCLCCYSSLRVSALLLSFGGAVSRTIDYLVTNELWSLDLSTWEWSLLFPEQRSTGAWPAPRFGHAGALIPAVITSEWSGEEERAEPSQLLVGLGGSFAQVLGDWWLFDVLALSWEPLAAPGAAPSYRFFPASAELHNRFYVFGVSGSRCSKC